MIKYKDNRASAVFGTFAPSSSLAPSASKDYDHPTNRHSGYIMSRQEYALLSTKEWTSALDVGSFFKIPANSFTNTEQRIGEKRWHVTKDQQDTLENVELTLVAILKCDIDTAHHKRAKVMGATEFGPITAPQMISRMQLNYGKPRIGEIKKALLCLNEPMDCNTPIDVMLRSLEEVHIFILASPEENRELTEVDLINHALIKLLDTGGFYTKALKNGMAAWSLIDASGRHFAWSWSASTRACL